MLKKVFQKKDVLVAFLFMILAAIGVYLVATWQINNGSLDISTQSMSASSIILISVLQSAITIFVLALIGIKLSRKVNLNHGLLNYLYTYDKKEKRPYKLNMKNVILAIVLAFILAAVTCLSEKFLWSSLIPEVASTEYSFDLIYILSAVIYGGVVEEVMLRLFFMSLLVFILWKLFKRNVSNNSIPNWIYIIAIILSSLLFALGHLPVTLISFDVTIFVILRMIILNTLGGLFFGYLYYKKGFEYSIISHMFSHIFIQLIWLPILF